MDARSAAIRSEALALPSFERAELAAELLASLEHDVFDDDPSEIDRAWGDEMVRRSTQIASCDVTTLSWDEILDHVAETRRSR